MAHRNVASTESFMPVEPRNEMNSSKKLSRNVCEKIRRDKLNFLIQELAKEVPIIASCQKKLDKSSILRLTVAYLKIHFGIKKMKMAQGSWKPDTLSTNNWGQLLQDAVDGFLIVVSKKGTIILLTEAIGHLLGHNQFDFIGKDIETIIHPDDVKLFRAQFLPRHYSGTSPDSGSSTRSFYIRFLNVNYRENACYTMIHIVGQLQEMSLMSRESNTGTSNDVWLNGVGRVQQDEVIQNISILDGGRNEWITQHAMDGHILYTDPRSCHVTGSMPSENFGTSVYMHINPEDIYYVGKSHKKILSEGEVPSTIFRLQTLGSEEQTYVESRSCVARDSWTHQPKFIVSLNTQLSVEEGTKKMDKQRKENTDSEITNTEELMSEIIKTANSLTNGNASELEEQSYGFTTHGDVIKALDNNESSSDKTSSVEDGYTNHRKRPLDEDMAYDTHNGNLLQNGACISDLDSFPDLSGIELSMIGSSNNHVIGSSEELMDSSGIPDDDDDDDNRYDFSSSNVSSNEGMTTLHEAHKNNRQETSILSDILHGKGSFPHPQNSFHSYPSVSHQDSSNSDISYSASSGLPHHSNCSSPSASAANQNFDEFTVFSDQLQRKHLEIGQSLNGQLADISRIEDLVAHSSHHKDTAQHQKLQEKLALIKGQQSQMQAELLKLKKDVFMTVQQLPTNNDHHNDHRRSSGGSPPDYPSLPRAQVSSGNNPNFNSEDNCEYVSNDSPPTLHGRHSWEAFGNHLANGHSPLNNHAQGADFSGYPDGSSATLLQNHQATSSASCARNAPNNHVQNCTPYGSKSDGSTSTKNTRDSVKFVCDGYKNLSPEDRISRIKTALGRMPVPKMFYPPANYSPENIV